MSGLDGLTKEQMGFHLTHLQELHQRISEQFQRAVELKESEEHILRIKGDVESLEAQIRETELAIAAE